VESVASPWLIRRFIDRDAKCVFVPAGEATEKAAGLGATSFDVEGCQLGHHGEDVSFNSFLSLVTEGIEPKDIPAVLQSHQSVCLHA
jgi:hypothetical protein